MTNGHLCALGGALLASLVLAAPTVTHTPCITVAHDGTTLQFPAALGADFVPGSDVAFAGTPGVVMVSDDTQAGALRFAAPGYVVAPGEKVLSAEDLGGEGYAFRFSGKKGGLRLPHGGTFAGAVTGTGNANIWVDSGTFTFSGSWQVAGSAQASSFLRLGAGAKAVFTPEARINNQMPDFIYARVFFVYGTTGNEVVEFAPGFRADHMGFPNLDAWKPDGFSVLFLGDVTLVTHETQGLPTVHKRSGNGNHTHHGVIDFHRGTKNTWLVTGEKQYYDGVVGTRGALTLRTEQDLLLTGAYFEDSHCYFGADADEPVALVKDGPATLALMCTQLYAPGSTMLVKEGTVAFHSDPADPGQYFRAAQPTSKRLGAHLQLQVAQGGAVVLQSAPGCSLASLTTDGAVTVSRAPVSIAGDCTSTANAAWDVRFEVTTGRKLPATLVTVGGTLAQAGTLAITPPAGARPGAYTVFSAKAFTGNFALKLPTGYEGTYADGVLTLTAVPKA